MTSLSAAEQDLDDPKTDLERRRVERSGGVGLGRLLGLLLEWLEPFSPLVSRAPSVEEVACGCCLDSVRKIWKLVLLAGKCFRSTWRGASVGLFGTVSARGMALVPSCSSELQRVSGGAPKLVRRMCVRRTLFVMRVPQLLEAVKSRLWFGRSKEGRCFFFVQHNLNIGDFVTGLEKSFSLVLRDEL